MLNCYGLHRLILDAVLVRGDVHEEDLPGIEGWQIALLVDELNALGMLSRCPEGTHVTASGRAYLDQYDRPG